MSFLRLSRTHGLAELPLALVQVWICLCLLIWWLAEFALRLRRALPAEIVLRLHEAIVVNLLLLVNRLKLRWIWLAINRRRMC